MRLSLAILRRVLPVFAAILTIASADAVAQISSVDVAPQRTAVAARITQAVDETRMVRLKGNVHPLARPQFDQGLADYAAPMSRMLLVLQRSSEQQAALEKLMQEQLSEDSPNFQKWLTPQQFGQQFGPTDADIEVVKSWLSVHGFHDIKLAAGRTAIEFSGNVGQVRGAFQTEIHRYLVDGTSHQANVSDPQIPAALAPVVAGVASLSNFASKSMRHQAGAFTRTSDGSVIPQFTGSGGQFYALGPADFAKIYNLPSSLNGTGSKIAIVGVSDINVKDVSDFRTLFGLPANAPTIIYNGPNPGIGLEEGEADLDVEWSGAVAPGAHIDYVVSQGTLTADPLVLSALFVIDNNSDDILSVSFGSCEKNLGTAGNTLLLHLWEQAAAQGITVTVSSGDSGSAGCDDFNTQPSATAGLAVSGFASTPFNIVVGGTDFDDTGRQSTFWSTTNAPGTRESARGYIPEATLNESCAASATATNLNTICASADGIFAGSGGPSGINGGTFAGYAKPAFQNGVTPVDGVRDTPDVSFFASTGALSNSFYLVCESDQVSGNPPSCAPGADGSFSFLGVGGTSASAPNFAGILALIEQSERARIPGSTGRQGNANFVLYKLAATSGNFCNSTTQPLSPPSSCIFYDVTKGNNSVPCVGGSPNCSNTATGATGVVVDPANTRTPAWGTATRYDYATGLGSINVANLISKWASAVGTLKATTATLKLNGAAAQVNITHGSPVTAAVTVAANPGLGTPTGDVSLIVPNTVTSNEAGVGGTLTSGTTSFTTSTLPGGSYSATAHYAGDGTFAPSDSNGVPVVVAQENSRLQAGVVTFDPNTGKVTNTNATSFPYGSPYVLRFDILNGSSNACQPLTTGGTTTGCAFDATGTVTITDNGTPLDLGTFPVNSQGHGEDQPIQLAPGSHPIVLNYSGDNSYKPSGPTNLNVTVNKGATTTTLTAPTNVVAVFDEFSLQATVTTQSNGVAPDCSAIVFKDGSSTLTLGGDCVQNPGSSTAPAQATFIGSTMVNTTGVHSFTASYPGDAYYAASTSAPQSVTVKLGVNLRVTANPTQVAPGQSTTLTALLRTLNMAPTPGPTGTVQFSGVFAGKIGGPMPCVPGTDSLGNAMCQASVSFSPASTDQVTATYSGDANYAPFNSGQNTTVLVVQPTFSLSGSSTTITAGGTGSSTVTLTPVGFTGTVTITCSALPWLSCVPLTINETSATTPASGALSITVVGPSSTTTALALPAERIYRAEASQIPPKPWWPWSGAVATAALIVLFVPRRRLRVGLGLIVVCGLGFAVSCGGGGSSGSGGGGGGGTSQVPTTTQLTVASTKIAQLGSLTVSSTVSGGASGGSVQFTVDGVQVGTLVPVNSGTTGPVTLDAASAPSLSTVVGTHLVTAHYTGSATSQPSQSGTLKVTVTGVTSLPITGTSSTTSGSGNISLTIS
jgi:hypothetical protein